MAEEEQDADWVESGTGDFLKLASKYLIK